MLNIYDPNVRQHLLEGNFGLEKENLRIHGDGRLSHSPHPFPNHKHIVRDFCENQTEINTGVQKSIDGAIDELSSHTNRIRSLLLQLPDPEYLWPFSNPPYIENERDIPVASFEGIEVSKTAYRNYLAEKYGKYKMTFSGIHVNFSFSDTLIEAAWNAACRAGKSTGETKTDFKNRLYLDLAQKMMANGWILVAATAASPLLDSSYVEKGVFGESVFTGMASVRCSEMGYWNEFAPVLDYTDIRAYADSINHYVETGLLKAPSELYYPIRLKPPGENTLENLCAHGVNHIELRMYDLNPYTPAGVDPRDIAFAQLLMVWLSSSPPVFLPGSKQIQAAANFKNAARYDLKTVNMMTENGAISIADAALEIIRQMRTFYDGLGIDTAVVLDFQQRKFEDADFRYAWRIRREYRNHFVETVLAQLKQGSVIYV